MPGEEKSTHSLPKPQGFDGVLRHPDGTLDIGAYAKLAHRERAEAIASSAAEAIRMLREMLSAVRSLAPAARSGLAAGKHPAHSGR